MAHPVPRAAVTVVFTAAVALAAALLFIVQPLFARVVLPGLGGSPSVWATSLLFFQSLLLAGYAYAHLLGRRGWSSTVPLVHLAVLGVGALWLPLDLHRARELASGVPPGLRLVAAAVATIGMPVLAVSATAPLLQRWLAAARGEQGDRAYALYAASNAGSLGGLLLYPVVIERWATLAQQGRWWGYGYVALLGSIGLAAVLLARVPPARTDVGEGGGTVHDVPVEAPGWRRRGMWLLRAAVAVSLMQSVTTYLTTDIAAGPLLWVLPLSAYLLTFIVAFAPSRSGHVGGLSAAVPVAGLLVALALLTNLTRPTWVLLALHIGAFFVLALGCHVALSADRPAPRHLTVFYLWLAAGGALGSLLNVVVAPRVFSSPVEYPVGVVFACLLRPRRVGRSGATVTSGEPPLWRDLAWGGATALLALASRAGLRAAGFEGASFGVLVAAVAVPLTLTAVQWPLRRRFAVMLAAVIACAPPLTDIRVLHATRNFFGVLRVADSGDGRFREFFHGSTLHGAQFRDPARRRDPLTYFGRQGPVGQVFDARRPLLGGSRVGIVGLGAGTMAAYAHVGEHWTFYEIDRDVVAIASDPQYFTFLSDAPTRMHIVVDDGRLALTREPAGSFALVVLDAFSSDSVPVHLMTTDAVTRYFRVLRADGWLLVNVSNRYVDLVPVVGAVAEAAGLTGFVQRTITTEADRRNGIADAAWIVLVRGREHARELASDARWEPLAAAPGIRAWTDEFADVFGAIMWRR